MSRRVISSDHEGEVEELESRIEALKSYLREIEAIANRALTPEYQGGDALSDIRDTVKVALQNED